MPIDPRIRVRPAVPADAIACQEIRRMAFSTGPIWHAMYLNGLSETAIEGLAVKMKKEIEEGPGQGKSKCHIMIAELIPDDNDSAAGAVPTHGANGAAEPGGTEATEIKAVAAIEAAAKGRPGEGIATRRGPSPEALRSTVSGGIIIAFAKWHLYREERPESEWAHHKGATREIYGDAANLDLCELFFGGLHKMRKERIGGRSHFLLSLIGTAPQYQRMGAAAALIKWATTVADAEGYSCWLESSPQGYQAYLRSGFRDVTVFDLDLTGRFGIVRTDAEDWGVQNAVGVAPTPVDAGWFRTVLMERIPVSAAPT